MSLYIGLQQPLFMTDIGNFFFTPQSDFDFIFKRKSIGIIDGERRKINEDLPPIPYNVIQVKNKAIDLVELLLPYILEYLQADNTAA